MSKTMIIREMSREPATGSHDRLVFKPGVNVLVGQPNTGKTRWLEMLDYLLGDDKKAEDKLGEDIFQKYTSVSANIEIGDEHLVVSRRWHEPGMKTKVFVGDAAMDREEFQQFLLERLGIPEISFPQGSPYGSRAWPTLRFRSLLRHMYRRQRLWSDFADNQPESDQHACIMQFVGLARALFSESYAQMIAKQKQINELESRRESYVGILSEISKELLGDSLASLSVTPEGLGSAIATLQADVDQRSLQRDSLMMRAIQQVKVPEVPSDAGVQQLSIEVVELRANREDISARINANSRRRVELLNFRDAAQHELAKLNRAKSSTAVLSPIQITHCPACDKAIHKWAEQTDQCYLCGQVVDEPAGDNEGRLEFEIEQLQSEIREVNDILENLERDDQSLVRDSNHLEARIAELQRQLQPTRNAVLAILPPQVLILEGEIARLQERVGQVERIARSLSKRKELAADIQIIRQEVAELESEVARLAAELDFEGASDRLADAMNSYVEALMIDGEKAWTQGLISVVLKERTFSARVGRVNWKAQLGGTLSLYFLFAYHYALMSLVRYDGCNYPGLCVLDFPAEVEGKSVEDKENFTLEPFVKLMSQKQFQHTQLIAAGSAFKGLEGANRIELTRVWKT